MMLSTEYTIDQLFGEKKIERFDKNVSTEIQSICNSNQ